MANTEGPIICFQVLYSYAINDLSDWTTHTSGAPNALVDFVADLQYGGRLLAVKCAHFDLLSSATCALFSAEGAYLKSAIPSVLLQVDLIVLLDQSQLEESAFQQVSIIT